MRVCHVVLSVQVLIGVLPRRSKLRAIVNQDQVRWGASAPCNLQFQSIRSLTCNHSAAQKQPQEVMGLIPMAASMADRNTVHALNRVPWYCYLCVTPFDLRPSSGLVATTAVEPCYKDQILAHSSFGCMSMNVQSLNYPSPDLRRLTRNTCMTEPR